MAKKKLQWKHNEFGNNDILSNDKGKVYISYQPNNWEEALRKIAPSPPPLPKFPEFSKLDSSNPETAIVIKGDRKDGNDRFLIFRGDYRKKLEKIYPNIAKMKALWKKEGGHFWSDGLDN